jgi:hypothetical protein
MLKAPVSRFGSAADFRASIHAADVALQRSAENITDTAIAGRELNAANRGDRTSVLPRTNVSEDGNRTALLMGGPAIGIEQEKGARTPTRTVPSSAAASGRRRSTLSFWLVVVPTLLAAIVGVSVVTAGGTSDVAVGNKGAPSAPPSTPTPSASAPEGPAMISIPAIGGSQVAAARILIARSGLTISGERVEDSSLAADTVLAFTPGAGELVLPGSGVNLTIASGSNRVPTLIGVTQAEAITVLHAAGFTVVITTSPVQGAAPGRVMESSPSAGASQRLGSSVTVVMAPPAAVAPIASPSATATPSPTASMAPPPAP